MLSIVRTSETEKNQTQKIKTFFTKNEYNGVNFGVVTKFKFRYLIAKFLLISFNQLTGLHPPMFTLWMIGWMRRVLDESYNQFHNILRLFNALPNFPLDTSETMGDYYLKTWYIRVTSQVAEQLRT